MEEFLGELEEGLG